VPSFIECSAAFLTLKMMLKYSLCTIHGWELRKGLRQMNKMNKLAMIISFEIILEK
jgi:hypothetical protein